MCFDASCRAAEKPLMQEPDSNASTLNPHLPSIHSTEAEPTGEPSKPAAAIDRVVANSDVYREDFSPVPERSTFDVGVVSFSAARNRRAAVQCYTTQLSSGFHTHDVERGPCDT